jgi:predicted DNA-binding transcriptional regulator YafY
MSMNATVLANQDDLLPLGLGLTYRVAVRSDQSPTARALLALEILQLQPGTTGEQLGERLGVSERAARRYVAILREAGIPVEASRGRDGGYRLGRGTRLPPVSFTEQEAVELVMAVLAAHPTATDSDGLVGSGLSKIIRALPERVGRRAAVLREHSATAPDRQAVQPDAALTSALVIAIEAHRRVRVHYRSAAGNEWASELDPWAVVVRHGRWYLLCHSHRADAIRGYRVDRVLAVEQTGGTFTPPAGLDPVATLEQNLGEGWAFQTRVVFEASTGEVAPWIRRPMGRLLDHPDGCVLLGSTNNPEMYAQEWLASVPFAFRVEGGEELRDAVAALAARCAAAVAS